MNMKVCPNCGEKENPEVAKFCRCCRYEFKQKNKALKPVLTGIVVLAVLGGALYFLYPLLKPSKQPTTTEMETGQTANDDNLEEIKPTEESVNNSKGKKEEPKQKAKGAAVQTPVKQPSATTTPAKEPEILPQVPAQPESVVKTYNSGVYTGFLMNGLRHGRGEFAWNNGDRYEGNFANDRMSGRGVLYSKTGNFRYEGNFANDNFNGQGTYYHNDGWRHEGAFKNGKPHGEGIHYNAKGKPKKGIWENGDFKSSIK